jgi:protein-S-isoprenylcysteine O-methyltransferase Ste14
MNPHAQTLPVNQDNLFLLACIFVVMCCTLLVFIAVLVDFIQFQKRGSVKNEKNSIVETGTMIMFFFLYYTLLRSKTGVLDISYSWFRVALAIFGTSSVLIGCFVNIRGRFDLGKNWSNQIRIYDDHSLISNGMYSIVRHPLYSSLIWMFLGASLLYVNYMALLATMLIFIPFMYYRAKQEEILLEKEFDGYSGYRKKVGMFFPKI